MDLAVCGSENPSGFSGVGRPRGDHRTCTGPFASARAMPGSRASGWRWNAKCEPSKHPPWRIEGRAIGWVAESFLEPTASACRLAMTRLLDGDQRFAARVLYSVGLIEMSPQSSHVDWENTTPSYVRTSECLHARVLMMSTIVTPIPSTADASNRASCRLCARVGRRQRSRLQRFDRSEQCWQSFRNKNAKSMMVSSAIVVDPAPYCCT